MSFKFTVSINHRYDSRYNTCTGLFDTREEAAELMEYLAVEELLDYGEPASEIEDYLGGDQIDTHEYTFSVVLINTENPVIEEKP